MTTGTVSHAETLKGWFVMVKDGKRSLCRQQAVGRWLGLVMVRCCQPGKDNVDRLQDGLPILSYARASFGLDLCQRISASEGQQVDPRNKIVGKLSMSNISKQHDGDLDIQTNEIRNLSMLIAPTISCWEAGRWELTRASSSKKFRRVP